MRNGDRLIAGLVGVMCVTLAAVEPGARPAAPDPGALVRTSSASTVGVLLDEIPGEMRDRVAAALIGKPAAYWQQRAAQQLRLTSYRLVFRKFFYSARRQQLPLPPEPLWNIELMGTPRRAVIDGHDVVAVDYRFSSVLLTDASSPAASEPRLRKVGGTWREPFILPVDPEMVLQRTGFACMDEEEFPFHSVDSEEVDSFYDQECTVEKGLSNVGQCHFTRRAEQSCVQALEDHVGRVHTAVAFERLPWDPILADQVRFGTVSGDEPDLQVYVPDFTPSRITYRYIHDSGCEVVEQSVTGVGWRRLLQFATSDENVGNETLTIGGVDYTISGHAGELDSHNLFEYSPCHNHYHFKYYGDFTWNGDRVVNSKKGFCLQSTARTANREGSPLHNPFASCDFQGVAAGWVDQYKAGLPGQWLDITGFPAGRGVRSFRSNPNGFLCEGTFVDEQGNPIGPKDAVVWAPTGLVAENGEPVEAPLCALKSGWDSNNEDRTEDVIPPAGEGLITTPCTRGQIGPLRNCGFQLSTPRQACTPGQPVTLTLSVPADSAPQVARLCEFSHALDSPIACRYEDTWVPLAPGVSDQPYTLATAIVTPALPATVTFACPSERAGGTYEPGGAYSIYTGPVYPDDARAMVQGR
jgi:hypothetical protein